MRLASCQASSWLDRTTSSVIRVELFPDLCYLWAEHGLLYTNHTRKDKVYRRCLFLLEFREDFIRRGDKMSGLVDCQSDEMFVIVCAQVESVLERSAIRVLSAHEKR